MVLLDGSDPSAETCTTVRFRSDDLRIEAFHTRVGLDLSYSFIGYVVLVVAYDAS